MSLHSKIMHTEDTKFHEFSWNWKEGHLYPEIPFFDIQKFLFPYTIFFWTLTLLCCFLYFSLLKGWVIMKYYMVKPLDNLSKAHETTINYSNLQNNHLIGKLFLHFIAYILFVESEKYPSLIKSWFFTHFLWFRWARDILLSNCLVMISVQSQLYSLTQSKVCFKVSVRNLGLHITNHCSNNYQPMF